MQRHVLIIIIVIITLCSKRRNGGGGGKGRQTIRVFVHLHINTALGGAEEEQVVEEDSWYFGGVSLSLAQPPNRLYSSMHIMACISALLHD